MNSQNPLAEDRVLVSVIVPVYNAERYLSDCLDSLLNQSLSQIEIICIDDASTDSSGHILRHYSRRSENLKVVTHATNKKAGAARNTGILKAMGDYIGFVDADDFVEFDMYAQLYKEAERYNLDVVDSQHWQYDGRESRVVVTQAPGYDFNTYVVNNRDFILNTGRLYTKIYRRKLFIENSILFPENLMFEDNPMTGIIPVYTKTYKMLDKKFYHYRVLSGYSIGGSVSALDRLETAKFMIREAKRRHYYEAYKPELDHKFLHLYFCCTLNYIFEIRCDHDFYLEEMRRTLVSDVPEYWRNKYFHQLSLSYRLRLYFLSKGIAFLKIYLSVESIITRLSKAVRLLGPQAAPN